MTKLAPELHEWINAVLGSHGLEIASERPLSALTIATQRVRGGGVGMEGAPADVLAPWSRMILLTQREVDQAVLEFVHEARRHRWPDTQIQEALSLDAESALDDQVAEISTRLVRSHPSSHPRRWPASFQTREADPSASTRDDINPL